MQREHETEDNEQVLHNLVAFAASEMARGLGKNRVRRHLVQQGIPEDLAKDVVDAARAQARSHAGSEGSRNLMIGLGWLALGAVITGFTYTQASSGGSYVVTTGLFAVGGIQTLLGLYHMMKGEVEDAVHGAPRYATLPSHLRTSPRLIFPSKTRPYFPPAPTRGCAFARGPNSQDHSCYCFSPNRSHSPPPRPSGSAFRPYSSSPAATGAPTATCHQTSLRAVRHARNATQAAHRARRVLA